MTVSSNTLNRQTFRMSRALEYFTEKELNQQIGATRQDWPLTLLKELIDNALDAAETAGRPPQIRISVDDGWLEVQDNGLGLPEGTIRDSLDFSVRVSDKAHYVSPSRGQLGNALKCLWAAPFVDDGSRGCVEIETAGTRHQIVVTLDRIQQEPSIELTESASAVQSGTLVRLHWKNLASYLGDAETFDLYRVRNLIEEYRLLNPHVTVEFQDQETATADPAWRKWRPTDKTDPAWYSPDRFSNLIAAHIAAGNGDRSVRDFIAEFSGLTRTQTRSQILEATALTGAKLSGMAPENTLDQDAVSCLLAAMIENSRRVKPKALGIIALIRGDRGSATGHRKLARCQTSKRRRCRIHRSSSRSRRSRAHRKCCRCPPCTRH